MTERDKSVHKKISDIVYLGWVAKIILKNEKIII